MIKHYLLLKMIKNNLHEKWVMYLLQITFHVVISFLKAKAIYFLLTDMRISVFQGGEIFPTCPPTPFSVTYRTHFTQVEKSI